MLKLLLEKRNKGEQLTEEELSILKEYDDSLLSIKNEYITKLEEEKTKLVNADNELQSKLKLIEELENNKKSLEESKKQLEEMVNKSESLEDIKIKLRQELEDKKHQELEKEKKRLQEMLDLIKQDNEKKLKEIQQEMENQKIFNEKLQFKSFINEEIIKRPYLELQLKKIMSDIETTDLKQSKLIYNFLVESVNHENEMEQYNKRKESGQNIFNLDINEKDKEKIIKNKQDEEFEDFLKRNPNIR